MTVDATKLLVLRWLATGDVGPSSRCMAFWLAFDQIPGDRIHPADPADLNRCFQLLGHAPELRERLPRMRALSKEWDALVKRWGDLEQSFMGELGGAKAAPRTHALLKEILQGAPTAPITFDAEPACWCHRCRKNLFLAPKFIVCPTCGNKRCPRAANHDLACTGSNAPGQPGSAYPSSKPADDAQVWVTDADVTKHLARIGTGYGRGTHHD